MTSTPSEPGASGPSLAAAVTAMAAQVGATEDVREALTAVVRVCDQVVVGASGVSVTLLQDRRPYTLATSSRQAAQLDEIQYAHGRGPCLESLATGRPVDAPELATETRWEGYGRLATDAGAAAVYAYPLPTEDLAFGALNVYASTPHAFSGDDREAVSLLAHQAAVSLTLLLRRAAVATTTRQLQQALSSRTVIDVAKGVLVAEHGVTPDEAFHLLSSMSQRRNVKLRDVAAELVERRTAAGTGLGSAGS